MALCRRRFGGGRGGRWLFFFHLGRRRRWFHGRRGRRFLSFEIRREFAKAEQRRLAGNRILREFRERLWPLLRPSRRELPRTLGRRCAALRRTTTLDRLRKWCAGLSG